MTTFTGDVFLRGGWVWLLVLGLLHPIIPIFTLAVVFLIDGVVVGSRWCKEAGAAASKDNAERRRRRHALAMEKERTRQRQISQILENQKLLREMREPQTEEAKVSALLQKKEAAKAWLEKIADPKVRAAVEAELDTKLRKALAKLVESF